MSRARNVRPEDQPEDLPDDQLEDQLAKLDLTLDACDLTLAHLEVARRLQEIIAARHTSDEDKPMERCFVPFEMIDWLAADPGTTNTYLIRDWALLGKEMLFSYLNQDEN